MAKVKYPMFSEAASGVFGGVIYFVCGRYAHPPRGVSDEVSEKQREQRDNFSRGAVVWDSNISAGINDAWLQFSLWLVNTGKCVDKSVRISGYNLFMMFFLKWGENGWYNYPFPP